MVCTGPVTYKGHAQLQRDIANLKAAIEGGEGQEAFMPSISPSNVEEWQRNAYYKKQEDYIVAIAEAMREEYKAIVDAGFLLQIDDPRLVSYYLVSPNASIAECRKWANQRVEVLNHALRGIPPEKVRHHTCYGINMGPRVHDMEVKHLLDIILKIKAGAYSFEAANPRHEHEWKIWGNAKLPKDKVLIPGVISHSTVLVEHPELVAERIGRFASLVGQGARDRRLRLRLRDLRRQQGGPPVDRLGEAQGADRWRASGVQGIVEEGGEAESGGEEGSDEAGGEEEVAHPAGSTSSARRPPIGAVPRLSAPP